MKVAANNWRCDLCMYLFQFDDDSVAARCPACGSEGVMRLIDVHDDLLLKVSEHVVLKGKNPLLSSKRKLRREIRSGERLEGSGSGKRVEEFRISDADSDEYKERIIDIESGVVLRDISEPLSDHKGGSERRRKK